MSYQLWKKSVRDDLKPRDEPYWLTLAKYKSLGVRKIDALRASWVAKYNDPKSNKRPSQTLGEVSDHFTYEMAKKAAEDWCEQFGEQRGARMDPKYTVRQAAADYVEDRRINKSEACATDIERRFKSYLLTDTLADMTVVDVWCTDLEDFRDRAKGGKKTKNKKVALLRAALRCAVRRKKCPSLRMGEWALCKRLKTDNNRREIYLDMHQRRSLIEEMAPEIVDIVRAAATTGARPGEIIRAKCGQYDPRTGVMTFVGKTGPRKVELSAAAKEIFERARKRATFERPPDVALADAWLFPYEKGKVWKSARFGHHMRMAVKKAELPEGTCLYTFRHIFITDQIVEGQWDALTVAKYVGTSLEMIQNHYGHLTGKLKEQLSRVQMI